MSLKQETANFEIRGKIR